MEEVQSEDEKKDDGDNGLGKDKLIQPAKKKKPTKKAKTKSGLPLE